MERRFKELEKSPGFVLAHDTREDTYNIYQKVVSSKGIIYQRRAKYVYKKRAITRFHKLNEELELRAREVNPCMD